MALNEMYTVLSNNLVLASVNTSIHVRKHTETHPNANVRVAHLAV